MLGMGEILFDEEPHAYSFRGARYNSVTQVIRLSGMGDDFSCVPDAVMDYARTRGRMVHLACHYYDEGDLNMDTVDKDIRPYVEAYALFRSEKKIQPIAIEQMMVSPMDCAICGHVKDLHPVVGCIEVGCGCRGYVQGLGIAGTPDLICFLDGERSVLDRKTSQHLSKSMGLQTAGYKAMWNRTNPNQPIRRRYGLRLERTGLYKLVEHVDPDDESAFIDGITFSRMNQMMEKWRLKYAA